MDCLRRRGRRALLRGGRRRVVRPSRGRLRGDVAGHAARNGRAGRSGSRSTRRRGAGRRSRSMTWRSRSSSPRAACSWRAAGSRQLPGASAELGGASEVAEARPGRVEGSRLIDVELGDGRRVAAEQFVFACGPWLPTLFPERRGRSHRGHQAGRRVRRTSAPATPASGPAHSRAGSTTTPRTTAFPRSTGGASRSRRTATASRSTHRRTTGSSTPTRSASLAATWRAASRTSPTGRSWRPAPASTRRPRTRTSSSTAIRRSTTCGSSGAAPATASSTDRRSARYVTRLLDGARGRGRGDALPDRPLPHPGRHGRGRPPHDLGVSASGLAVEGQRPVGDLDQRSGRPRRPPGRARAAPRPAGRAPRRSRGRSATGAARRSACRAVRKPLSSSKYSWLQMPCIARISPPTLTTRTWSVPSTQTSCMVPSGTSSTPMRSIAPHAAALSHRRRPPTWPRAARAGDPGRRRAAPGRRPARGTRAR